MIHYTDYRIERFPRYYYRSECYTDCILSFDTETTTFFNINGKWVIQDLDKDPQKYSEAEKVAVVYIWMLSINDTVVYGREISDFFVFWRNFIKVNPNINIIYVHNLGYDFEFFCEHMPSDINVFAKGAYRPMYVKSAELCVEFRCSYMLTNMSLEKCSDEFDLPVKKRGNGDLIYNRARTPFTELTEDEIGYCEYDCLVIYYLIKCVFLERYKCIADIPLTQTGQVRREVKALLKQDPVHTRQVLNSKPDLELYAILTRVICGGYTHANYFFAGKRLKNVASYDKASSYPDIMCTRKFPVTPFKQSAYNPRLPNSAWLLYVKFKNFRNKGAWSYVARSKVDICEKGCCDNNKVLRADTIIMWITDIDLDIIKQNCVYDGLEVLKAYRSQVDYLPKDFVLYILRLYGEKTSLKSIPEKSGIYLRSKQLLNAVFGMSIARRILEETYFNPITKEWCDSEELTDEVISLKLRRDKPFLPYALGIWVLAWARYDLWELITAIGFDCVYCDTDSVKFLNVEKHVGKIDEYNARQAARIKAVCAERAIDEKLFYPVTTKGVIKPLGFFEKEPTYDAFLTLGAKKYCYTIQGKFGFTVAGLRKKYQNSCGEYEATMKNMSEMHDTAQIRNGRTVLFKVRNMPQVTVEDYNGVAYTTRQKQGVAMLNANYTFNIADDFRTLIIDGRNKYTNDFRTG